eukprot:snap_masked-scaffold_3-processed-gene-15.35-mRNA-1 protein AED:1.00 eAED:1.00 QI:0/0/0/0/1/1/2/0/82
MLCFENVMEHCRERFGVSVRDDETSITNNHAIFCLILALVFLVTDFGVDILENIKRSTENGRVPDPRDTKEYSYGYISYLVI